MLAQLFWGWETNHISSQVTLQTELSKVPSTKWPGLMLAQLFWGWETNNSSSQVRLTCKQLDWSHGKSPSNLCHWSPKKTGATNVFLQNMMQSDKYQAIPLDKVALLNTNTDSTLSGLKLGLSHILWLQARNGLHDRTIKIKFLWQNCRYLASASDKYFKYWLILKTTFDEHRAKKLGRASFETKQSFLWRQFCAEMLISNSQVTRAVDKMVCQRRLNKMLHEIEQS